MASIFYLSSRSRLVEIEEGVYDVLFYKSSHLIAYAILAWCWWRALTAQRMTTWSILLSAFAITSLYGLLDEIHQSSVPGRHATVYDVLFDTAGALLMVLLIRRIPWLRKFPENISFFTSSGEGNPPQLVS